MKINSLTSRKIVSIALIIILLLTTKAFAANDNFTATLKANSSELKREDTVIITIGLKDINVESGDKGIGAYTASIEFDPNVLEYVATSGTEKWEKPKYTEKLLVGETVDGEVVKEAQSIGTITFKVKKDAKIGETTITLKDFYGTTAENDVLAKTEPIKLTIVDNSNNNDNNNNSGNDNNNNSNNNNNQIQNPNINNITNDNTANGTLPKTGEENIILIGCIGLVIACSTFCYIKMKDIN